MTKPQLLPPRVGDDLHFDYMRGMPIGACFEIISQDNDLPLFKITALPNPDPVADVEAWRAKENDAAYQRGYAEAERLGNIEIEGLKQALQNVIKNDKTYYNHHDPRPDGRLPKEDGGTIWLTPKEIAKRALPQPPKEAS